MSSNSDDIQAAGSDTRPPMLDRTDYESWSQRIRLYCRGKENGLQILQSIDQGPFELGTTRDTLGTTPEGGVLLGPERPRTYEDLSDTEKKRYDADVRATNIVLQGLPKDIYKLINHNIEAKAIWDNVKMLLDRFTWLCSVGVVNDNIIYEDYYFVIATVKLLSLIYVEVSGSRGYSK
ncbi:hypothetical protein Tco_0662643 [Tanacetum coccineum]